MKDFLKSVGSWIKNYFNPPDTRHYHDFGAWQLASKGLAGAFNGEIQVGSIQYRKCKDKACEYIEAEKIL